MAATQNADAEDMNTGTRHEGAAEDQTTPKKLYRSISDRYFAGVCGGVAEYFEIDANIVRILWAIACFLGGTGLIAYIAAWIIIPENPSDALATPAKTAENKRNLGLFLGAAMILLGVAMLADHYRWQFDFPFFFPFFEPGILFAIIIIAAGVYLIFRKPSETPEKSVSASASGRTAGTETTGRRLTRSITDRKIAGVCGGIAQYFNLDPSLVRLGFVILGVAAAPFTIVSYIIMIIVLPEEDIS